MLVAALGGSSAARADELQGPAQGADPAGAEELAALRQLFSDGIRLEAEQKWGEALDRFQAVARVKMTPQIRFHVALCEEHTGRLVSALNNFELATEEARLAGAAALDVATAAPERAKRLRERVPKIRFVGGGKEGGPTVRINGKSIHPAVLLTDLPVDPGESLVEVTEGGKVTFAQEFRLVEGALETIDLRTVREAPTEAIAEHQGSLDRTPMYVALAAGGIGIAGAGIFLWLREKSIQDVRATCDDADSHCSPNLEEVADRGEVFNVLTVVMSGVGVLGLGTAGILWLTEPSVQSAGIGFRPSALGGSVVGAF